MKQKGINSGFDSNKNQLRKGFEFEKINFQFLLLDYRMAAKLKY